MRSNTTIALSALAGELTVQERRSMTAQPEHDSWTTPTWIVQAVFDPDEPWRDFAYTIGLVDKGLPELHIRCQPSLGEDAAPDWRLSQSDMCAVLNELGARLGRGSLSVGDEWTSEYDMGLTVVRYRLDPAEEPDDLRRSASLRVQRCCRCAGRWSGRRGVSAGI